MSLAEQLEISPLSPAQEVAQTALRVLTSDTESAPLYRPDFMTKEFADEVVEALAELGVEAAAVAACLKRVLSKPGTSYAIELAPKDEQAQIIPFPQP